MVYLSQKDPDIEQWNEQYRERVAQQDLPRPGISEVSDELDQPLAAPRLYVAGGHDKFLDKGYDQYGVPNTSTPTTPLAPEDLTPKRRDLGAVDFGHGHLPGNYERHIVLSDYQYRLYQRRDWTTGKTQARAAHDPIAMAAVERFMVDFRPTHVHNLGDMADFYSISKHCRTKPDKDEVAVSWGATRKMLRKQRVDNPSAYISFHIGNHEVRWQRYLEQFAEPLVEVLGRELSYNAILDAEYTGVDIVGFEERAVIIPRVLELTHGDKVSVRSGVTAHRMLEKGVSGVSGHTHRLAKVYRTTRLGTIAWVENGCLCSMDPDWMKDPDWQQGFTVMYVDRDEGRFHLDDIPIIQSREPGTRRIIYGGDVWEARSAEIPDPQEALTHVD